ncbi:MAG: hypothetical protein HZB56_22670 [Deltaproteobacteria bacterium]|nr:hypothetical protein [Deltaproteobacteria bacterium]
MPLVHPAAVGPGSLPRGSPLSAQEAARFLEVGLESFLKVLLAAVAAPALAGDRVPGGFSRRFQEALAKPTLGGLHEFILWGAGAGLVQGRPNLGAFLASGAKGGRSWLADLVRLRNAWLHPKEESPEAAIERARELLVQAPDTFDALRLSVEEPHVAWLEEGGCTPLFPLVCGSAGEVRNASHLDPAEGLCFRPSEPAATRAFAALWPRVRALDPALEDPTPDDLRRKAERLQPAAPSGADPWWISKALEPGAPALLLEPGSLSDALAALARNKAGAISVHLRLQAGESPLQALGRHLGVATTPDTPLIGASISAGHLWNIALDATAIGSRDFLSLLYWLADLRDAKLHHAFAILVQRTVEQLEEDERANRDRFPEPLEGLLRRPPRSRGGSLGGLIWPHKPTGFRWPWRK